MRRPSARPLAAVVAAATVLATGTVLAAPAWAATPTISTTPSDGTTAGGTISDSASLSGGSSPSGTVTFSLYAASDPTCAFAPVVQRVRAVRAAASSSGAVRVTVAGTYHWIASYSGDSRNDAVSSECGEATAVTAGDVSYLDVQPPAATVAAGESQAYTATGYDTYDNSLGDVTAETTFSIGPDGDCVADTCTATVVGEHTVTGTDGDATGDATLTVEPGDLADVVVLPSSASIAAGDAQDYTAEGFDAYGNSVGDVTSDTTFSIDPDGSCDGAACTATVAGEHTVTGTDGAFSDDASLVVNAGAVDSIEISPSSSSIAAGESQDYTATGTDAYGNAIGDVTSETTFTIAPAQVQKAHGNSVPSASCDGATCTATQAGAYTVTGTDGSASDSASLDVTAGALDHLEISPSSSVVAAGSSREFSATAYDQYGNQIDDVTASTEFSITPDGSCSANACTATMTGAHTVTGDYSGVSATASLRVRAAALAQMDVTPSTARIAAGHSRAFQAQGFDAYGNSRGDITDQARWSITAPGSCTDNRCGSFTAGEYTVLAKLRGVSGQAMLTVVAADLDHLVLSPARATIQRGRPQDYTSEAFDAYGNSRGDVTMATRFTIDGGGTCVDNTCSATRLGDHTVTGHFAGAVGTAILTVSNGGITKAVRWS